jgi:hypothetical protein
MPTDIPQLSNRMFLAFLPKNGYCSHEALCCVYFQHFTQFSDFHQTYSELHNTGDQINSVFLSISTNITQQIKKTLAEIRNSVTVLNKTIYDHINNLHFIVHGAVIEPLTAVLVGIPLLLCK